MIDKMDKAERTLPWYETYVYRIRTEYPFYVAVPARSRELADRQAMWRTPIDAGRPEYVGRLNAMDSVLDILDALPSEPIESGVWVEQEEE